MRVAEPLARRGDRRPPVQPDDLRPRGGHRLEEVVAPDAEMDPRCVRVPLGQLGEHAVSGEDEAVVVGDRERAGPRVEQLERPSPGVELDVDERHGHRRQGVHQLVPHRRSVCSSALVCS